MTHQESLSPTRPGPAVLRLFRAGGPALLIAAAVGALSGCSIRDDTRPVTRGDAGRGLAAIQEHGCGTCHSIPGVPGANGLVGPPLSAIADRGYIGGVLPNTEPDMIRWLIDPPAVDPRTAMPAVGLTEEQARDVTAYLYTLRAEPRWQRLVRGLAERYVLTRRPRPNFVPTQPPTE
ncbi:MAG TPA: c-type cytochrome [Vicinamibacterales bacterium]|nr:c-type cytochrome [Vicinamibacterales bacterium]